MRAMPASCSMRARKRRTAGGSQRSTKTSRRRERWGTLHGRRKRMPNANFSSASWPVRSDSEDAIDAPVPRPNVPEAQSPALSARPWPVSASTIPRSASISIVPFAPAPTAPICPTSSACGVEALTRRSDLLED